MFLFTLKKIIGLLLKPLSITLLLLFLSIVLYKYRPKLSRLFLIAGFSVLVISSTSLFSGKIIQSVESKFTVFEQQPEPLDFIVILGCGHVTNHQLPAIMQLQTCSLQRLLEGFRIYQMHPEATVITSGYAFTDEVSNAKKVKLAAISLGIPEEKIIAEERPKDTKEEARLIAPLLKNKRFALVTNAVHLPRAYNYFETQQLSPIPAPTGFIYKGEITNYLSQFPKPSTLSQTTKAWHEALGTIVQKLSN